MIGCLVCTSYHEEWFCADIGTFWDLFSTTVDIPTLSKLAETAILLYRVTDAICTEIGVGNRESCTRCNEK